MKRTRGKIERHVEIVVAKRGVLFRVQHLEQRRCRVAAKIAPQLVHFIQHEHRVVGAGAPQGLNDLSRQCADVGAPVAADLGFIVHAAHGNARELAPQRPGDRLPQRGLAHARRPDEAQDRPLQYRTQLQHRQVIEDPILHLFEIVVVLVQNPGGAFHVHLRTRRDAPGQCRHPFQVRARDAVLGRGGRYARKPLQFAHRFGLDFFGQAGGFQLFASGLRFRGSIRRLRRALSEWLSTARAGRIRAGSVKAVPAPGIEYDCAAPAAPARVSGVGGFRKGGCGHRFVPAGAAAPPGSTTVRCPPQNRPADPASVICVALADRSSDRFGDADTIC